MKQTGDPLRLFNFKTETQPIREKRLGFFFNPRPMDIDKLIQNTQALDTTEVVRVAMEQVAPELLEAQRQQMLRGFNSTGGRIGKYRNPRYAQMKFLQNPLAGLGFVDLRLTGVFQGEAFVEIKTDRTVFGTKDPKVDKILGKYGSATFGLSPTSIEEVQPSVDAAIAAEVKKRILK